MKLKNYEIYNYTLALQNIFNDNEKYIPIKLNFIIQRNKKLLYDLAVEIEYERTLIMNNVNLSDEEKNKELYNLENIEQDVNVKTISIEYIADDKIELTSAQMNAILFMFSEE
jgi:hypothetical protein